MSSNNYSSNKIHRQIAPQATHTPPDLLLSRRCLQGLGGWELKTTHFDAAHSKLQPAVSSILLITADRATLNGYNLCCSTPPGRSHRQLTPSLHDRGCSQALSICSCYMQSAYHPYRRALRFFPSQINMTVESAN